MATPRTTVRRLPARGSYDPAVLKSILDEGLVCHVGFADDDGQPFVIPTSYGRAGDVVYIHGSPASRMLRTLRDGIPVCVTVTLLDGLVLARSAFHHSMNYRSAVLLGTAAEVTEAAERDLALKAIVDHIVPGRWDSIRGPSEKELRGTLVLRLPIDEASAKIRTGPPVDDEEDYASDVWAGVLPLVTAPGVPVPDPRLPAGTAPPPHVTAYRRP
jgi:nitroimidazol reductase NimA-like FMN-containing flavoprotein (pyridoxamine 5'-phosphate oxidase superfamily)